MKVNKEKFQADTKQLQLTLEQGIQIPEAICPEGTIRMYAERILEMYWDEEPFWDYHTMEELDKRITLRYWQQYDGLHDGVDFSDWYVQNATNPDDITRAKRWLAERKKVDREWLIIKESVRRAAEAAQERRRHVMGH